MNRRFPRADAALLKKDFYEIWSLRGIRLLLIVLPLLVSVILPVIFLLVILLIPIGGAESAVRLLSLIPASDFEYGIREGLFCLVTDRICPMLFLSVPIIISAVTTSSCFVGERERGTIETLLLTPLSPKRLARTKLSGCMMLSLLVTVLSFILFTVAASVGDILLKIPFFLNAEWLITLFLLAPLFALLSALCVLYFSGHEQRHDQAFRTSSFLMFPVVFMYTLPFAGLYQLNPIVLLFLSLFLLCLDFVLLVSLPHRFTAEKLL